MKLTILYLPAGSATGEGIDLLHPLDQCRPVARPRAWSGGRPGGCRQLLRRLTRTILKLLGHGEEMIERVPDRPGHDRRYAIDASKLRNELGWSPRRSAWPEALAETIEWYRAHEDWWRPLKADAFNATMLSE